VELLFVLQVADMDNNTCIGFLISIYDPFFWWVDILSFTAAWEVLLFILLLEGDLSIAFVKCCGVQIVFKEIHLGC
jgi:hypothetical protein